MAGKNRASDFVAGMVLLFAVHFSSAALAQDGSDPVTGSVASRSMSPPGPAAKRSPSASPCSSRSSASAKGPVFRPDLATRNPDLVNEAFRQYGIDWGIPRVGRLFKELDVPLTHRVERRISGRASVGMEGIPRAQPNAPIVAHGMNNTSRMLPLGRGLAEQKAYIRRTLDLIAAATGVRPTGWSSPSVYSNGDTMQAMAAEGITHTLDQMDSDIISRLKTPDGVAGAAALSGRDGRHGPVSGADENAVGDRGAVAGLRARSWPLRRAPIPRERQRRS